MAEASETLNASLDLDFILSNLLLVAMSRLLVGRGLVLLAEEGDAESDFTVAATKGRCDLDLGDRLVVPHHSRLLENEELPPQLRAAGVVFAIPIRRPGFVVDGTRTMGFVGLGSKATGAAFEPADVAFARSLVGISSSAIHSAQVAARLQEANRTLAGRVQELDTLFELSHAFGATLEREAILKLLGLSLMGQFLVERHAVVLQENGACVLASAHGLTKDEAAQIEALVRGHSLMKGSEPLYADRIDRASVALRRYRFAVALPIRHGEGRRGLLLVGPRATGRRFSEPDAAFLTAVGALALSAIENADLVQSRIEKEQLEREMRLARSIQERLLPHQVPEVPGYDIATLALASRHMAGDYFDLVSLPDGRTLIAVADVAGKGAPAALLMANLQACLHLLAAEVADGLDLGLATQRVNRLVCRNTEATSFITFFWGVLGGDRLAYVNAGHNPPRLVRAGGRVDTLDEGGLLLGVLPDASYETGEVHFAEGDALVLYTDGVTEARSGDSEFGEERLDAVLIEKRQATAAELVNEVHAEVAQWTAGALPEDDLTLLVVKREERA